MTNKEWLEYLANNAPDELAAWFDADCSETESINKLTAERDAAYAKNRALKQHISNMQEGRNGWHTKADKLQVKVAELTAERNELQAQIGELIAELRKFKDMNNEVNAECAELQVEVDLLRDEFLRACDNARDKSMIMDEGMA